MRQYPRQIKQLIRQYAAQSYEAELSQALRELEHRSGSGTAVRSALRT